MAGVEVGDDPPVKDDYEDDEFVFVDPEVDRKLMYIQVAEVLNIPVPDVGKIPAHWVGTALIKLEAQGIFNEKKAKKKK